MATLPPPPTRAPDGSFAWLDWYNKLQRFISQGGIVPWANIDFTGSSLNDIVDKQHNYLTGIQGGTAGEHYHLTLAEYSGIGNSVPNSRQVIAGNGLTGGGTLAADRTFNVVAGDGSITVNPDNIVVGVISDTQHGARGGGGLHADATTSVAGFMSATDKTNLNALVAAGPGVPTTRQVIAGTGMTGGGALSADVTLNVIGNADGSIIANANDVQVGVLATDGQHGVRGGGTQHAVVTTSSNGFMSAADKVKLDSLGTSSFRAYVSVVQPVAASTFSTIVFTAQEWDDLNEYDTATGQFIPSVTGKYCFAAGIHGTQFTPTARVISLFVNGTETVRMQQFESDSGNGVIAGTSGIVSLTAGDVVTLKYLSGIAENISTGSSICYFSGYRIK